MKLRFTALAFGAVTATAVAGFSFLSAFASPSFGGDTSVTEVRPAPEFGHVDAWLNSEPLKMSSLRGKVVLVDFWTYTCGNCLNHLPYVQKWDAKYKNQGLVVVGVHTPEFAFEKSTKNVTDAIKRLHINHAVAQDNDYETWMAFGNQYWPAVYLIDKRGRIVYSRYGEGRYDETEKKIQALLAEKTAEELQR
jgi:thiol-disulfide isomerase/thioredoxin